MLKQNSAIINGQSMTTNITSAVQDLSQVNGFCVHAVYTGSPVGSLIIEVSNDGSTFYPLVTQAISTSGNFLSNQPNMHAVFARVRYTFTSGSGSLTVNLSAKE